MRRPAPCGRRCPGSGCRAGGDELEDHRVTHTHPPGGDHLGDQPEAGVVRLADPGQQTTSSGSPICGIVTITQRSIGRRIRSRTSPIITVRPSQSSSSKPASVPLSTSRFARARRASTGLPWSSAIRASDDVVSRCRSASSKCGTSSSRARRTARPTCRLSRSCTSGSSPRALVPSGNATTGVGPSYEAERESRPSIFLKRRVLLPLPSLPSASRTAQSRSPSTPRRSMFTAVRSSPTTDLTG